MKKICLLIIALILHGCNGEHIANTINGIQVSMAGNKPPASFRVANLQTMKEYVFNLKHYTIAMPEAKAIDFIGNTWQGFVHYNKDLVLIHDPHYHISISTYYYPQKVGEYQKAILNKDLNYFKEFFKRSKFKKMYFAHLGKESYPCLVTEYMHLNGGIKELIAAYDCYKLNPAKTKYQSVEISLTYSKPLDPKLAKIYTYQDLKRRAKRMLDSLYIKSWW